MLWKQKVASKNVRKLTFYSHFYGFIPQAYPKGTFWYHSHIGGQRVDGLFGALIIKPKAKANSNTMNDVIMHTGDWFHSRGSEVGVTLRLQYCNYLFFNKRLTFHPIFELIQLRHLQEI